jgi:hypothetical protein
VNRALTWNFGPVQAVLAAKRDEGVPSARPLHLERHAASLNLTTFCI